MTGLEFLVLLLATQRLTTVWFEEIATPVRNRLVHRGGRVGYLASCRLCVSVWAGAVIYGLWQLSVIRPLVWVLALSGGMLLLETAAMGMRNGRG